MRIGSCISELSVCVPLLALDFRFGKLCSFIFGFTKVQESVSSDSKPFKVHDDCQEHLVPARRVLQNALQVRQNVDGRHSAGVKPGQVADCKVIVVRRELGQIGRDKRDGLRGGALR